MPAVIYVVLWSGFREVRTREEGKTAALISDFHKLYNAADFDGFAISHTNARNIGTLRKTGKLRWMILALMAEHSKELSASILPSRLSQDPSRQTSFRRSRKERYAKSLH
jgi:hypothetical protein